MVKNGQIIEQIIVFFCKNHNENFSVKNVVKKIWLIIKSGDSPSGWICPFQIEEYQNFSKKRNPNEHICQNSREKKSKLNLRKKNRCQNSM